MLIEKSPGRHYRATWDHRARTETRWHRLLTYLEARAERGGTRAGVDRAWATWSRAVKVAELANVPMGRW